MMKKLIDLFRRRTYSSNKERKEFNTDSYERLEKKVKKTISNEMQNNSDLHNKEKKQRIEIEVLVEILRENPDYYIESEINKLYYDIVNC